MYRILSSLCPGLRFVVATGRVLVFQPSALIPIAVGFRYRPVKFHTVPGTFLLDKV